MDAYISCFQITSSEMLTFEARVLVCLTFCQASLFSVSALVKWLLNTESRPVLGPSALQTRRGERLQPPGHLSAWLPDLTSYLHSPSSGPTSPLHKLIPRERPRPLQVHSAHHDPTASRPDGGLLFPEAAFKLAGLRGLVLLPGIQSRSLTGLSAFPAH